MPWPDHAQPVGPHPFPPAAETTGPNKHMKFTAGRQAVFVTCLAYVQAVVAYSESQIQDLLALRRLNWAQLGRLEAERSSLLARMAQNRQQLADVQIWAAQLQANIAEEHQCYLQHLTAVYLGVSRSCMLHVQVCLCCLESCLVHVTTKGQSWGSLGAVLGNRTGHTGFTLVPTDACLRALHAHVCSIRCRMTCWIH